MLVKAQLAMKPYDVISASSGKEALEMIKMSRPDVVLLDIMMPKIDGLQVLQAIRKDPETADLPVIMITAFVDKYQKSKVLAMGADGYLVKPLAMDELHETLEQVFAKN